MLGDRPRTAEPPVPHGRAWTRGMTALTLRRERKVIILHLGRKRGAGSIVTHMGGVRRLLWGTNMSQAGILVYERRLEKTNPDSQGGKCARTEVHGAEECQD